MSKFIDKIDHNSSKKKDLIENAFAKYAIRSMIAGALLGLTTFAGVVAADNINTLHPSLGKFVYAFLFAFGLLYILFSGMELATSNMMYLSSGSFLGKIKIKDTAKIIIICTLFNLIGALMLGFLVGQTHVLSNVQENSQLVAIVQGKLNHNNWEIFTGAILANILVNISILSYLLVDEWSAKIPLVLSAIFMFVYLGLDHVVANFGSFALMMFSGRLELIDNFTLANVARQWIFAFLGNLIGGGLFVGITYSYLEK